MKKFISRFAALAVCVLLYACSEESENPKRSKIQFAFTVASMENSSGRTSAEIPDGSVLKITLTTPSGTAVLTNHEIPLLTFGDEVISEPIQLTTGQYRITDFMIVKGSTVLYATPKNGSPLAGAVAHSLPYGFVVSKDQVKNVAMDVIDATLNSPQAFGYASFGVNVVEPLPVAVFRPQGTGVTLTDATLTLYDRDDVVVQTISLGAKTNYIPFTADAGTEYRMVISKPGYIPYGKVTSYTGLIAELSGAPWQITLEPLTEYFSYSYPGEVWPAVIANGPTTIKVYYSDETEERTFATNYDPEDFYTQFTYLNHTYWQNSPTAEDQVVRVTGQLENIVELSFYETDLIRTQDLINLRKVFLDDGDANLSMNEALQTVFISNGQLTLPGSHNISSIQLKGDVVNVDAIIDNIHTNTLAKEIYGGNVNLGELNEMPSENSLTQLYELASSYGWTFSLPPGEEGE